MIIDTHAHIDFDSYDDDLDEVIDRAKKNGITHIIIPGADLNAIEKASNIANKYANIYYAVAAHPTDLKTFDLEKMKKFIKGDKCVAIGECGLDYFKIKDVDLEEKKKQEKYFRIQIELAIEENLPLVIHSRDADDDMVNILNDYDFSKTQAIIHCIPASKKLVELVKKDGYFCSIGGISTFKNAQDLRDIIEKDIDINKILLETDSPFLTPHPHRGKRNEPFYVKLVLENIANIKKLSFEEAEKIIFDNTKRAFRLNLP